MDTKKGVPLYSNLVNLKSNTMKNTLQRYDFCHTFASVFIQFFSFSLLFLILIKYVSVKTAISYGFSTITTPSCFIPSIMIFRGRLKRTWRTWAVCSTAGMASSTSLRKKPIPLFSSIVK